MTTTIHTHQTGGGEALSTNTALVFPYIDKDQTRRQLDYLGYKSGEPVYLRFFYHSLDQRKNSDSGRKADWLRWDELQTHQQDGRGVYVVVNGSNGGHEDKNIKQCAAIFCEWDNCPVEDQLLRWETVGFLEPTFTIYSGDKSVQPYWIFDQPLENIEQWRELQQSLIGVMGADPANKNPSRVFRLAGGWHIKPGRNPVRTEIVQESGEKYSPQYLLEKLREIKQRQQPQVEQVTLLQQPPAPQHQFVDAGTRYDDITVPVPENVPLEICLSKESRQLIQSGVTEGGRNDNGAKLARDIIGTASYLQSIKQRFDGDPWQLFLDYCHRCPSGNGWSENEWETIWKFASKRNPAPSCTANGVDTCISSWYWNNHVKSSQQTQHGGSTTGSNSNGSEDKGSSDRSSTKKLSLEEGAEQVKQILQANYGELTENIRLEEVRGACKMSSYDWERKIVKPIKRDLDAERFRLDLLGLLAIY